MDVAHYCSTLLNLVKMGAYFQRLSGFRVPGGVQPLDPRVSSSRLYTGKTLKIKARNIL